MFMCVLFCSVFCCWGWVAAVVAVAGVAVAVAGVAGVAGGTAWLGVVPSPSRLVVSRPLYFQHTRGAGNVWSGREVGA